MTAVVTRALAAAAALLCTAASAGAAGHVNLVTVSGSINPATADYLIQAVKQSESEQASALLIELDTPGGLVSSTKDIIQAILNSKVPIIVYVAPRGAWAASAGTFITVAGHVAAMAPSTSIGAAAPIGVLPSQPPPQEPGKDGEAPAAPPRDVAMEKAENMLVAYMESIAKERDRNVEWVVEAIRKAEAVDEGEALDLGVIDLVAEDRRALFEAIEGREVRVAGQTVALSLVEAEVVALEMTLLQRIFSFLADPNLAVVLLLGALAGLYIEFNNPGLIVPGVIGVICGVLLGISLQILPFSWVGLLIMLLGIGFFVAEVFVTSFGLLFAAGIACLLLGGTMIFDTPTVSDLTVSFWQVLVPSVAAVAVFGAVIVFAVGRSFFTPRVSGVDEMIGMVGRAASPIDPRGKVFVRGEYWDVVSEEEIPEGVAVEVMAVEGIRLRVRRATPPT